MEMRWNQYIRIVMVLGMVALLCGAVHAAGVGIIAETQTISAGSYPVCTAPCECISENEAAQRWGTEGYDRCNKNVCGQSANAMTQYYCLHQIGGSTSSSLTTCQAPCECMAESTALARWGSNGYTQCTKSLCGQDATSGGTVPRYCFRQWGSTLVIGGAATTAATTVSQQTVQAPAQTQVQTPVQTAAQTQASGATAAATPSSAYTWPAANVVPQPKTPVGIVTILAAIGVALLVAAGMRRK
jgi:hypothetical protein